jgi:hypothetical protein
MTTARKILAVWLLVLIGMLALVGCRKPDEGTRVQWAALALPGKTLELMDDKKLLIFPISANGMSPASIGTKAGPVAAPLFFWKIEKNVLRISVLPDSDIFEELSEPALKENVVTVTDKSGDRVRYKLTASP